MTRSWVGRCIVGGIILAIGCGKSASEEGEGGGESASGGASGDGAGGSSGDGGSSGNGGNGASSGDGGASGDGANGGTGETGGSGGNGSLVEYFRPGTRLKPIVIEAAPGLDIIDSSSQDGWFDTELDFRCNFLIAEDGVERCFPTSTLATTDFADASCTERVLLVTDPNACGSEPPSYLVGNTYGTGTCLRPGYRLGAALPASTPLFSGSNGTCQPRNPAPTGSVVYGLEAVPPETFVGHRRVHRAHEGDLDAYVREGDDGSWQVLAFYDPERESACNDYSPRVVPPSRCIPEHVPWLELFGDALCTTRVYEAADDECVLDTPVAIMETRNTPDGCGGIDEYDLYEIAETRETPLYRAGANSSCEPRTSSGETVRGWVGGASIDPATLPALETIEVGNGAVRGAFLGISGVPFFPVSLGNGPFLEASSGESCRPEEFADGALRCVPGSFSRLGSIIYYADPTCTSTPLVRLEDDPCERVPIAGILIYEEGVECRASRIVESRALGPRTTAAIVYRFEATTQTCAPLQTSTDTTAGFYPFGDTLDADEVFPRVERIMRD